VQYVYSLLTDRITEHEAYRKGARIWLRHCATIRKVAGSIPDGVIRIFHRHKPSDRTTALGSTQLLREYFLRINAFKCWLSGNLGASASWNPQGLSRPVQGLLNLDVYTKGYCMKKWNSINISQHRSVRELFPRVKSAEAWSAAHSFWVQVSVRIHWVLYPPLVAQCACTIEFNLLQILKLWSSNSTQSETVPTSVRYTLISNICPENEYTYFSWFLSVLPSKSGAVSEIMVTCYSLPSHHSTSHTCCCWLSINELVMK